MTYNANETVVISILTYSDSSKATLVNTETIELDIYEPDGDLVVDGATPTNDDTGTYHYDYTPLLKGVYVVEWIMLSAGRTLRVKDKFMVE